MRGTTSTATDKTNKLPPNGLFPRENGRTLPFQKRQFVHTSVCSRFLEGLFAILAECS